MNFLKHFSFTILVIFGLFSLTACNDDKSSARQNNELIVATSANFAPFEYRDGEAFKGIDIDIARHIAQKLDRKLVIKDMEFDSVVTSLAGGNAHIALSGLTVNETRKRVIDFSDTYFSAAQMVIARADDTRFANIGDKAALLEKLRAIPQLKIGVQIGTTGEFYARGDADWGFDGFKNAEVKSFSNGGLAVTAMNNHQVDIVIIDEMPARAIVKAEQGTRLLDIPLTDEKYAIGVSRSEPKLRDSINAILQEMKQDDALETIINAYFAKNSQGADSKPASDSKQSTQSADSQNTAQAQNADSKDSKNPAESSAPAQSSPQDSQK